MKCFEIIIEIFMKNILNFVLSIKIHDTLYNLIPSRISVSVARAILKRSSCCLLQANGANRNLHTAATPPPLLPPLVAPEAATRKSHATPVKGAAET
jgi:hypothetical protein